MSETSEDETSDSKDSEYLSVTEDTEASHSRAYMLGRYRVHLMPKGKMSSFNEYEAKENFVGVHEIANIQGLKKTSDRRCYFMT